MRTRYFLSIRSTGRHGGFSLLELLLVLAIIGIATAIAVPRYMSSIQNYRLNASARRIVTDLAFARSQAKATSSSRTFQVNVVDDAYLINEETKIDKAADIYRVDLKLAPYHTSIKSVDLGGDAQLVFNGFGDPDSNGAIIINTQQGKKAILIDSVTGEISISEVDAALDVKLLEMSLVVAVN